MSEPVYRTELSRNVGGGWDLQLDSDVIASTDEALVPQLAAEWARGQMGEGVTFENGLVSEPADSGYWVAGPTMSWDEFMAQQHAGRADDYADDGDGA